MTSPASEIERPAKIITSFSWPRKASKRSGSPGASDRLHRGVDEAYDRAAGLFWNLRVVEHIEQPETLANRPIAWFESADSEQ